MLLFVVLPSKMSYFSHDIIAFAFSTHPGTGFLIADDVASLIVFMGISGKSFDVLGNDS